MQGGKRQATNNVGNRSCLVRLWMLVGSSQFLNSTRRFEPHFSPPRSTRFTR